MSDDRITSLDDHRKRLGPPDDACSECGHPAVFRCDCGCVSFWLNSDGTIECNSCFTVQPAGDWTRFQKSDEPTLDATGGTNIVSPGSVVAARDYALRVVGRVRDDLVYFVGLCANGRAHAWLGLEDGATDEQRQWIRRRIDEITEDMTRRTKR